MDRRSHLFALVRAVRARPSTSSGTSGWVWASMGGWYVQASSFLLVGVAAGAFAPARGMVGLEVVGADTYRPWGVLFVTLGLASLLLAVFVLLGHGFALPALAALGVIGTVGLSVLGSWVAPVVPIAMCVALLITLLTPALDHVDTASGMGQR